MYQALLLNCSPEIMHRFARTTFIFIRAGLCRVGLLAVVLAPLSSATAAGNGVPGQYNPVADPRAIVTAGPVRFTVLTPQLIRMEWAADGKFEDHASLTFLNRNLPVPEFTHEGRAENGDVLIKTSAL